MATGHEQRQRQQQADQNLQAQQDAQEKAALQTLEEGQELSPEQASQLQPQLGNSALAALLARSAVGAEGLAGELAGEEQEVVEELVEVQDEEQAHADELKAPVYGGGGGDGAGGPGGPADPWDMGKLFGGDDDDAPGGRGAQSGRSRPAPVRRRAPVEDEDFDDEDDDDDAESIAAEHFSEIQSALPQPACEAAVQRSGDSRYLAVEDVLTSADEIARLSLSPEDLVRHGGPHSALGRPLAIMRFLASHTSQPLTRCLGRGASAGAAALLVPQTGTAGASARLAALAVCTEVAEGGGHGTDQAVALALVDSAWPRTLQAARKLSKRGRLHAPQIAAAALGRPLAPGGDVGLHELPTAALAYIALTSLMPTTPRVEILGIVPPPLDHVATDEATASLDALLAELTGGRDPRALPGDPVVDSESLQPVLDSASDLVNDLGRAQVEFAAAAVAVESIRLQAPVRHSLIYGDRALRMLAREVVTAGEALAALRGSPRPGSEARAQPQLQVLRDTVEGLDALRAWLFGILSAAAITSGEGPTNSDSAGISAGILAPQPPPLPPDAQIAEAQRRGGDSLRAREALSRTHALADHSPQEQRMLHLWLGLSWLEAGQQAEACTALSVAMPDRNCDAEAGWQAVTVGLMLSALLISSRQYDSARNISQRLTRAAVRRQNWLAVAAAAIDLAAILWAEGRLQAAAEHLVATTLELRQLGSDAASHLTEARLVELRAGLHHQSDAQVDGADARLHAFQRGLGVNAPRSGAAEQPAS